MRPLVLLSCLVLVVVVLCLSSTEAAEFKKARDMDAIKEMMQSKGVNREDLSNALKDYLQKDESGRKDLEALKERLAQIRDASPDKREELLRPRAAKMDDSARSELLRAKLDEIKRLKEVREAFGATNAEKKKDV